MNQVKSNIDIDYAYSYCKKIAIKHYENFPVGSLLIPGNKRNYIYSIYAFARYADDIADLAKFSEEEKIKKLNELDNELNKVEENMLESLVPETQNLFIALSNTIAELYIPIQEFRNLLVAFRQDAVTHRYNNFEELIFYADYSANPIGHLVLYTFGYRPKKDKEIFNYSDKICTALQLTNFWQDILEDMKINRVYIPLKIMNQFNYTEQMLFEKIENDNFRNLIKYLVDKTKILFDEGKEIANLVKGRLKLELKATIEGGIEILSKIEGINYNVLSRRVTINNFDKLKLLGKIFWK